LLALQKIFLTAKDAKIFKNEVQDLRFFSKQFIFPSRIINFSSRYSGLRGKKVCVFFQWTHGSKLPDSIMRLE